MAGPNRIKKKYIDSKAIDGSKVLFLNEDAFKALGSNGTEEVELFKLNSSNEFKLLKMPQIGFDPSKADDLVRKQYLDNKISSEEMLRESEDIRILLESKEYTDAQIFIEREARIQADASVLDQAKLYTDGEITLERVRAIAAEQQALVDAKFYTDAQVSSERQRALAAEAAVLSAIDGKISSTEKGAPNGVAPLDANGKISAQYIPAVAINDVYVVETIAERDALTVQVGDVAKVTKAMLASDGVTFLSRTYIHNGTAWVDLSAESDVDSVNGKVGNVVLNTSDIAEFGDYRYYTAAREQSQKDYADAAVSVEHDRAMIAEELINDRVDATEGRLTLVEDRVTATEGRITSTESRLTAAEARIVSPTFRKQKITIAQNLSYIELDAIAIANSLVVCVDRLNLQLDDDYSVSVVNNKTRLTWANEYAAGSQQGIVAGDNIYVTYYAYESI